MKMMITGDALKRHKRKKGTGCSLSDIRNTVGFCFALILHTKFLAQAKVFKLLPLPYKHTYEKTTLE